MDKNFLTEKQAAEFYGTSVKTLQAWRFKRVGPAYYKIGRSVRYVLKDLQKYAEQRKVQV